MIDPLDPRMLRRPPRFEKQERTAGEKLFAQWPAFAGVALMLMGGVLYLFFRNTSSYLATRSLALFIAVGFGLIGYWAFANRNDDYTSV